MTKTDDTFVWNVRAFVYEHFARTTHAPQVDDIAHHFGIALGEAAHALQTLHEKHALFLEPGTTQIRLANPFSAIPTQYHVEAADKTYQANCAWDTFGIVAALNLEDATIRSVCTFTGEALRLRIERGQVVGHGEIVHFLVPFRQWYDDLVFT